jgi:hypothetical protein
LLATVVASTAGALEPVDVRFRIEAPQARAMMPPELERHVAERIAARCRDIPQLRYWEFRAATVPSDTPRLDVTLKLATGYQLFLEVSPLADGEPASWQHPWLVQGDVTAKNTLPPVDTWNESLVRSFDRLIDGGRLIEVRKRIGAVAPVARQLAPPVGGPWPPLTVEGAVGILPLPRTDYVRLSNAIFRVGCLHANTQVQLRSEGTCHAMKYPNAPFIGVVIRHLKWDEENIEPHLSRLADLQPKFVLIDEFRDERPLVCDTPQFEVAAW